MSVAALFLAAVAPDPIAGTWEGTSLCQVKPSPCHDEHVIYRVQMTAPQHYRLDAYKILAGKELYMGAIDLSFVPSASQLRGTIASSRGSSTVLLDLKGNHLSGRLTLTDGTLYRRIEVDKR